MKTIKYYHKNSDVVAFERIEKSNGFWSECTYDEKGNQLTYKDSKGVWSKCTYNEKGKQLAYKSSYGYCYKFTYDENGKELTYKSSYGTYMIGGKDVSKEEFEQFTHPKPCLGKKVVVDDVEYILS